MTTLIIAYRSAGFHLRRVPVEAIVWLAGLAAMATLDPSATATPSGCLFEQAGLSFCPGCGLGHSIAHLARGHLAASFAAHPLGLPAVAMLLVRSGRLLHAAWRRTPRGPTA